jgi:hypothetical protein
MYGFFLLSTTPLLLLPKLIIVIIFQYFMKRLANDNVLWEVHKKKDNNNIPKEKDLSIYIVETR